MDKLTLAIIEISVLSTFAAYIWYQLRQVNKTIKRSIELCDECDEALEDDE